MTKAKNAVNDQGLYEELVSVEKNYYKFVDIIKQFETRSITIVRGLAILQSITFDQDSANIKDYLVGRLSSNEIQDIVNMSRSEISPLV